MIGISTSWDEIWIAMQLSDSAFPGGTLANSQGLESAFQHKIINSNQRESLMQFFDLQLEQARFFFIPFVRTAWSLGKNSGDDKKLKFKQLDKVCQVMLSNEVSRRSSIHQGKGFLRIVSQSFKILDQKLLEYMNLIPDSDNFDIYYHHSPLFGLVCSMLNLSMEMTERIFMRLVLRDLVSAASRLNLLGPIEGSRLQAEYSNKLEYLLKYTRPDDDKLPSWGDVQFYNNEIPCQTSFMTDLVQARHDLLYSRLFNS